jgi:cupin superfamily acireductone dioxygenase involved in methionine salvage
MPVLYAIVYDNHITCFQQEGKRAQLLKAGDVIVIYDGVKHWHGATKDSWFQHIAITAGTPEWLEPVDNETYNSIQQSL